MYDLNMVLKIESINILLQSKYIEVRQRGATGRERGARGERGVRWRGERDRERGEARKSKDRSH